jgi:hypothetical protein
VFAAFLDRLSDGVLAAAADGTDILLCAFGPAPVSRVVAQGLGIPSVGVYLAPAVPTREFAPPGWPGTDDLGPIGNLAAGRELFGRAGSLYAEVLPRLRAQLRFPATPGARRRGHAGWLADLPRLQLGGAAAQQIPQIGIMKAIGARADRIGRACDVGAPLQRSAI